ncbi:MAG: arginase family protein, partial [Chloroflexota bacterium]
CNPANTPIALTLIWFDAHGDFNTPETTPSGFIGGMPLAMMVGLGDQDIVENAGMRVIPEDRVILTDARDLDPGERDAVEASAVRHLPSAADLLHMNLPDGPLYVHFDADILNPEDAPAHRYAAPGGPSADVMRQIFERLANTGRVQAVSLSAWDAANDEGGKTGAMVMDLVRVLLG